MKGKPTLYIDQHGVQIWAKTVQELREKCGGGTAARMFTSKQNKTYHCGYVIGNQWFTAYRPVEIEVG